MGCVLRTVELSLVVLALGCVIGILAQMRHGFYRKADPQKLSNARIVQPQSHPSYGINPCKYSSINAAVGREGAGVTPTAPEISALPLKPIK